MTFKVADEGVRRGWVWGERGRSGLIRSNIGVVPYDGKSSSAFVKIRVLDKTCFLV